jgi:hypothetical protein
MIMVVMFPIDKVKNKIDKVRTCHVAPLVLLKLYKEHAM